MNNIDCTKYRNEAFGRLRTDRDKFTSEELQLISDEVDLLLLMGTTKNIHSVVTQITRDVRIYPKYDCLAMWLDWYNGLVQYEPDLIEAIATKICGLGL